MIVIEHGEWVKYTPSVPHPDAPPNTIYARRNVDHVDWYDFILGNFRVGTAKMVCRFQQGKWIVSSAVFEGDRLFPPSQLVLEVIDYTGDNPARDFNNMIYDPITKTFSDPTPARTNEAA